MVTIIKGPIGSGKTTVADALKLLYESKGISVGVLEVTRLNKHLLSEFVKVGKVTAHIFVLNECTVELPDGSFCVETSRQRK